MKNQVIETIRKDFGKVDMVVYSMAAPRRTMPDGTTVSSVLKTVGKRTDKQNHLICEIMKLKM